MSQARCTVQVLSTGGHRNLEKLQQQRGLEVNNPSTSGSPHMGPQLPRGPSQQSGPPWLARGTHRALGHDVQVLEGPIKDEVSAHRRPLLDDPCGVRVAITPWAQVDLRSETTRSEAQGPPLSPQ